MRKIMDDPYIPRISDNKTYLSLSGEIKFKIWNRNITHQHSHENYAEVFVVMKGSAKHNTNYCNEILNEGDVRLMLPGTIHEIASIDNKQYSHINIGINLALFKELCDSLKRNSYEKFFEDYSFCKTTLSKPNFENIKRISSHVIKSSQPTIATKTLFFLIIGYLLESHKKFASNFPDWFSKLLDEINQQDFSQIKVQDIYNLSHYSPSMLSIYFKQYLGMTVVQYYNNRKLKHACRLLELTNDSMLEIASALGFDSLSHFNHLFKAKYHVTPTQYRKNFN